MEVKVDNYLVYIHINKLNNKVYVGQTCDLYERWRCNGKNYFNSLKFFRALKKYGWDNFEHKIIVENLTKEEADKYEIILIKIFNSIEDEYNLKEGGSRGNLSKDSLNKMSKSLKEGYKNYPERIEKIRNKSIGRVISTDTRIKMSLNAPRALMITIEGISGCMKYWANILEIPYYKLKRIRATEGKEAVQAYIELSWSIKDINDFKDKYWRNK